MLRYVWTSLSVVSAFVAIERAIPFDDSPIVTTVSSTMRTSEDHIRQLAFDGDATTYFASDGDASPDDSFTLILDEPVTAKVISVISGHDDGKDRLNSGALEVSADGVVFEAAAAFSEGKARAETNGRNVRAIRIKPGDGPKHPLVVREITIEADRAVATFAYPVEFTVDVADAPEMQEWADDVARLCERWYPRINEELKSDGFTPARQITMALKSDYNGVAEAGGRRITGSVKFFKDHPDDKGAMVHETTHIVQRYRGGGNPGWLVEGVADYIRFFVYEPGKIGRLNPDRVKYNDSYRTSAAFLAYLTDQYDKQIVNKLNALMRSGKYREDVFQEITGKTLQELGEEWRKSLRN